MFRPEEAILWPWLGGWVRGQCKAGNKNVIADSCFCGDTKKEMRWTESFVKSSFIDFCFFNSWTNTDTHTNNIKYFCFDIGSTNDHCVDDIKYLWKVKWSEVKLLSCVWLFATPWTVAYQAPPSLGFSRLKYWSGLHFFLQEIFPTQGLNPGLPHCRHTLYHLSHQGSSVSVEYPL